MKQKLSDLFIFLAITCCFGAFPAISFRQEKEEIQSKMTQAIQESITKDYHKRLFQQRIYKPEALGRKIKRIKVISEKRIEEVTFKDSLDEESAHQLVEQYIFTKLSPVIPDEFNVLFKKELKERDIVGKTGIVYRHNGIPQYSDNDSVTVRSALRTHIKMLDVRNTASVQGWVDYNLKTWLEYTDTKSLWIMLACYIATLGIFLFKKKKKQTTHLEKPMATGSDSNDYCNLGKIKLDLKRRFLYIDGMECYITNMDFDLLRMFMEAPEHYLAREDIKQAFWPKENEADNKINSHITSLRSKIKDLEGYAIEAIRGKGYRLVLPLPTTEN